MKNFKSILIIVVLVLFSLPVLTQTVYTVTKTTDPDPFENPYHFDDNLCDPEMLGTFQWAIRKVNDTQGSCVIEFDIQGDGPHEIAVNNYLPTILNSVSIDGATQNGYTGTQPIIIIDGQNSNNVGLNFYKAPNSIINALEIKGYLTHGIIVNNTDNTQLTNNFIEIRNPMSDFMYRTIYRILIANSQNVGIYGNSIGSENSIDASILRSYGILLTEGSSNCIIGDTINGNRIFNCSDGVRIGNNLSQNTISGNRIYDNNYAIFLGDNANNNQLPPIILDYIDWTLSGTSSPNDIIEIFGSTGEQNANEYLISTTADAEGNWSVEVATTYEYFIATATDVEGNTSELSNAVKLPTLPVIEFYEMCVFDNFELCFLSSSVERWIINGEIVCSNGNCEDCITITNEYVHNGWNFVRAYRFDYIQDDWRLLYNYNLYVAAVEPPVIEPAGPFCVGDGVATLSAEPTGGIWTGPGTMIDPESGEIDLNTVSAGSYLIFYHYTEILPISEEVCVSPVESIFVVVYETSDATITPAGPFCEGDAPVNLTAATAGGVWSGVGITDAANGTFNPVTAGVGTHTISYHVGDEPCDDTDQILIIVHPNPDATITNPGFLCENDPAINLNAATVGGTWSGTGITNVTNGTFDPSVAGVGTHIILYTIDDGTCDDTDQISIIVHPKPDATITNPGDFCENDSPVNLTAATGGGIWSGPGITNTTNGTFNSSVAGVGTHTISYHVGDEPCDDTDQILIIVHPNPDATITNPGFLCENDPAINLNAATVGGTWSGTGITNVTNGTFDPSVAGVGTHIILYTIDDGTCDDTDQISIIVHPKPDATIMTPGDFCVNDSPVNLTAATGGGIWSGPGIIDAVNGIFDPSVAEGGTHLITYTVIVNGCIGIDEVDIVVHPKQTLIIESNSPLCVTETLELYAQPDGMVEYLWVGPVGFTSSEQNPFLINVQNEHSGSYYLTVTDANGCTWTSHAVVEINENSSPIFEPIGPYCQGDIPEQLPSISANGVSGSWSPASINTSTPGSFEFLFTPNEGECVDVENVTIIVDVFPAPQTSLIDLPGCLYINNEYEFVDLMNDNPAFEWEWSLGDEIISTEAQAEYLFTDYGYYCINLLISSEMCGTISYSETIFVNPNVCACSYDAGGWFDYDITDGHTINSYDIEEWNEDFFNNNTVYAEGDIVVEEDATLIISNITIKFAPKGRIIVKPRGKLMIKSYVTLSNIFEQPIDFNEENEFCEGIMWQGIEIWGNKELPSNFEEQGILEMHDVVSVIIENAHIAILSGARNMDYLCDSETYTNIFNEDVGRGFIHISGNLKLVDNGFGIKLLPREPLISTGVLLSGNVINGCNFNTTGEKLRDPKYLSTSPNPYPNPQNPWAGNANPFQRTDAGIWMHDIKGLDIRLCDFQNLQHGILSFDAQYNVYYSSFLNSNFGIKSNNLNSGLDLNHEIAGCYFDGIPGYEGSHPLFFRSAISIMGGKYDYIHDNTFGDLDTDQYLNQFGIFTNHSSAFRITENEFKNVEYGIFTVSSGIDGGFIGAGTSNISEDWEGNRFHTSNISISTWGNNSNLKLKCNTCDNSLANDNEHETNFLNYGELANQGMVSLSGFGSIINSINQKRPAGNEFLPANEPDLKTIWSSEPYTYYRHSGPPEVIPFVHDDSPATINIDATNAVEKLDNYKACPPPFFNIIIDQIVLEPIIIGGNLAYLNSPYNALDSLNNEIDYLKYELEQINTGLDNGKTYELLSDIYGNMPSGRLQNKLIANSPLSDTVIYALLTEYPLSHGNFKNVMLINLPVKKNLRSLFYTVLKQIPPGIANQLLSLQANNPISNTPGKLEQEIDFLTKERQLFLNHLIISLTDTVNNRREDAILLLENEGTVSANKTLVSTYISAGEYELATQKLAELPADNPDIADFISFNQMLLSVYQQEKTLYDLDSIQIDFVRDLAYKCPSNLTSANAQSILYLLYREEVPLCPQAMSTKSMFITDDNIFDQDSKINDEILLGDNYPDPVIDITYIPYYLPDGISGYIVVHDIHGRVLWKTNVCCGENIIVIDTNTWAPGVYSYTLVIDNTPTLTKRMIISK